MGPSGEYDEFKKYCQHCGTCCDAMDESYIFMFPEDVHNLAAFLNYTPKMVVKKYCHQVFYDYVIPPGMDSAHEEEGTETSIPVLIIKIPTHQKCLFYDPENKNCRIYEARPIQCKRYPLLECVLTEEENLEAALKTCPALALWLQNRPQTKEWINQLVLAERQMEYDYYLNLKRHGFKWKKVYYE